MPGVGNFGKVTAGLDSIGASLDGVVEKAKTTQGVIGDTRRSIQGMSSDLTKLDESTERSVERQERARRSIEENHKALTALDQIYEAVGDRGNDFSQDVQLQLEAVRLGKQSLEDFLSIYGDAVIQLEDGSHRIRDLFSGADLNVYRQQIQDLVKELHSGGADIAEVLDFLKTNANTLTQGLQKMLDGFRQGKVTLEQLLQFLERAREDFRGEEGEALIQALLQGLAQGELT